MGPMQWSRLDGRVISDEFILSRYYGNLTEYTGKKLLEELRVARKWNMTIEEFNEWMDSVNDDMAQLYFHNIHCNCGLGSHYDNILWSMGAMGTAHVERKNVRGSDWPIANPYPRIS